MKNFKEYIQERYLVDEPEDILRAVADYLNEKADELEREAPYAETEIRRLNEAAYEVWNISYDL